MVKHGRQSQGIRRVSWAIWGLVGMLVLAACGSDPTPTATSASPTALPAVIMPSLASLPTAEDPFWAWDFTLSAVDGTSYTLSAAQGQWVILNFWATWCEPCVAEMPVLQTISTTYADTVMVWGINVREEAAVVRPFLAEQGITYPILLTPNTAAGNQVLADYQAISLPQTVIVAPNGEIVWRQFGELSLATFEATWLEIYTAWEG